MFPGTVEASCAGIIFWLFPAGMAFFFPFLRRNGNLVEWGANRQIRLPVAGGRERWRSFSWRIHDAEKLLLSFFMKKCLCLTLLSLLNSSEIMTLYSKSQSVKFFQRIWNPESKEKSGGKLFRGNREYKDDRDNRGRQNCPLAPIILMVPIIGILDGGSD